MATTNTFRNSAAFGKRIEYFIIGRMLKEGLDVYVPLVDDHAVDAIVKRRDGPTALIQIKARSSTVAEKDAALFAAITHDKVRPNYWFIFYSERMDMTWIMTSEEFDRDAVRNRNGKNIGKRTVWFNGNRFKKGGAPGEREDYCLPQWEQYRAESFGRIAALPDSHDVAREASKAMQ